MSSNKTELFTLFSQDVSTIELPEEFTFPFYYEAHELCKIAAQELQESRLINHRYDHNFGLSATESGMIIGKMFGVLVVQAADGTLGYLSAFSGKLADSNDHEGFVPPVYDMLTEKSHFKEEEVIINDYTITLESIENDEAYRSLQQQLKQTTLKAKETIAATKAKIKKEKAERKELRKTKHSELSTEDYQSLLKHLEQESIRSSYHLKDEINYWKQRVSDAQEQLAEYQGQIDDLKEIRKAKSNKLQRYLFKKYSFLNATGDRQDLLDIFDHNLGISPPAGAGECAAPKLLQYAYIRQLRPIAIAEFWWGQSPKSQVRKHKEFYPACRGKCEPILGHMLKGLQVEKNPITAISTNSVSIELIYEDDDIVVINKPPELLSVPGKTVSDSVWARMKSRYPNATGPLIVHRLDMSTSGIMIIALNKESHKYLQHQFIKRLAQKRYEAILAGKIEEDSGTISLPLRVDLDNRPHQLVCYEYGKKAMTHWVKTQVKEEKTWIDFYPKTGRTHQLRVHAAHQDGLNAPILGDDLYGQKGSRLYLHAAELSIKHPITKEQMTFTVAPNWKL